MTTIQSATKSRSALVDDGKCTGPIQACICRDYANDINAHCYVDDYITVEWYHCAYGNPIYPFPDRCDNKCEL